MPPKHTIKYLDSGTRRRIDEFLAAEGRSVDEFLDFLRDDIGLDISRSSAHRYLQNYEQVAHRMRESREMAAALCQEMGPAAEQGRTGELIREIMQNLVFDHLLKRQQDGETGQPKDLLNLAGAINELSRAQKTDTDRIAKERAEARAEAKREAAEQLDQASRASSSGGLSADAVARLRKDFLGVREDGGESGGGG